MEVGKTIEQKGREREKKEKNLGLTAGEDED